MDSNYNEQLQKFKEKENILIEKAKKEGYRLCNGKLTKDKFIPVIEIYARGETDYESYGVFYMFRKIIPLTEEQLDMIKSVEQTKQNLVHDIVYGNILDKVEGLDLFYEILDCGGELEEENIDRIVQKEDLEEEYYLKDGQKLYLEFFFDNEHNIDGYISIYDMLLEDVDKQEDINIYFKKYLTYN